MTFAEATAWIAEHSATFSVSGHQASLDAYGKRATVFSGLLENNVPRLVEELRRKTGH